MTCFLVLCAGYTSICVGLNRMPLDEREIIYTEHIRSLDSIILDINGSLSAELCTLEPLICIAGLSWDDAKQVTAQPVARQPS